MEMMSYHTITPTSIGRMVLWKKLTWCIWYCNIGEWWDVQLFQYGSWKIVKKELMFHFQMIELRLTSILISVIVQAIWSNIVMQHAKRNIVQSTRKRVREELPNYTMKLCSKSLHLGKNFQFVFSHCHWMHNKKPSKNVVAKLFAMVVFMQCVSPLLWCLLVKLPRILLKPLEFCQYNHPVDFLLSHWDLQSLCFRFTILCLHSCFIQ